MKKQDHLFMGSLGVPACQLYVLLSRKRQTHTHMNSQTLSWAERKKNLSGRLANKWTLPGPHTTTAWHEQAQWRKVQKSSQMRQLWKTESADRKWAIVLHLCFCVCGMWWYERDTSPNEAMQKSSVRGKTALNVRPNLHCSTTWAI